MTLWTYPDPQNDYLKSHALILLRSFAHWIGRNLIDPTLPEIEQARQLFIAPFAVVSHNTAPDPIFNYGNETALKLFEFSWNEFTALPSRQSAEPMQQDKRAQLLAQVTRDGYIEKESPIGVRITKTGRRFRIEKGIVWNLLDENGLHYGQAATYGEWSFL
jgi:hypothetical protein